MKERVYQGLITGLVVAVSITSYQLYTTNSSLYKNNALTGVDIASEKPKYEYVDSKKLLLKQQKENKLEKVKLDIALLDLEQSMQKSMDMINEYNQKNPNSAVAVNFDADAIQNSAYDFDTAQINYERVKQKIYSSSKKYTSPTNTSPTSSSSTTELDSNIVGGYAGGISSGTVGGSTPDTVEILTKVDSTTKNTTTPTQDTPVKQVDEKLLAYQASITNITKVIDQINKNLN